MSSYETITYESVEGIGTIALNRPDRLNGITNQMMRELYDVLTGLPSDHSTRVVVLTGTGKGF